MKRFICILLCVAALLALYAFGKTSEEKLSAKIAGQTWRGRTTRGSISTSSAHDGSGSVSVITQYIDEYTVTFSDNGVCTAAHTSTTIHDHSWDGYPGQTVSSEYEYDCQWSVNFSGYKATVTLTCDRSMGTTPRVYTLTLDKGGNIKAISGADKAGNSVAFEIEN